LPLPHISPFRRRGKAGEEAFLVEGAFVMGVVEHGTRMEEGAGAGNI
jgi:hypothetical protein